MKSFFQVKSYKMSFNLDDPLADILSGGSDDSFFDDDILGKKKNPKQTTPLTSRKSAIFNLDEDTKPSGHSFKDIKDTNIVDKNLEPTPGSEVPRDANTSTKSKTPVDFALPAPKDKHLERLGSLDRIVTPKIDPHSKSIEKRKSSISILDDLLGTSVSSTKTYAQEKTSATAKKDFDFEELIGKQNMETQKKIATVVSKPSISSDSSKPDKAVKNVPAAAKSTKKSSDDWLGIFDKETDQDKSNPVYDPGMPAWLVGKDIKSSKSSDPITKPKTPQVPQMDVLKVNSTNHEITVKEMPTELKQSLETIFQPPVSTTSFPPVLGNAMIVTNEDITQEGAALYMQQQESQLMVALQLRAQEEKLAAIQQRQEESKKIQSQASLAQQAQLAAMLETQAAHRQQMQTIITTHQQRINQRIKALLTPIQPESGASDGGVEEELQQPQLDTAHSESPRAKERRQLLQLVDTLQDNHHKEMDLMETSYRRQLAISDAALAQWEVRTRAESERLAQHYTERLEWAETEAREQRARAQEDARAAAQRYEQLLADERGRSAETAKVLQEQHAALMDNIKNAVSQERTLLQDSSSFSTELTTLLAEVRESRSSSQRVLETAQELQERSVRETTRAMQEREKQVQEMLTQLAREREALEREKLEERETAKLLEQRFRHMTQTLEEETSAMKQKRMEFEFEKATFNKQTEFAKNILKQQEEEIKTIKEDIQKEYAERVHKIEEERSRSETDAAVAARERASAHNLKLELEKVKAELQAQSEDVSEARGRLARQEQQLRLQEQSILVRSRDLDLSAKCAIEKQSQANRMQSEAETAQRKYEDRARRLQEHLVSLNTRERDIAREKVALSRERLDLHNQKKQLEGGRQCSLCRSMQNQPYFNPPSTGFPNDGFVNLNSEYLSMGVSRDRAGVAGNTEALEQQMSNLLNRETGATDGEEHGAGNNAREQNVEPSSDYKEVVDPKLLLLRLDVEQVISRLSEQRHSPRQ